MLKFIFLDTETTGLDPNLHAIIEVGATIDVLDEDDGPMWREVERINFKMRPHEGAHINPDALAVHGYGQGEILEFPDPHGSMEEFKDTLGYHVDKFNKRDKLFFVGYNAGFDFGMVHSWFKNMGDNYCGSWFFSPPIDVAAFAAMYLAQDRHKMPNFRLETVGRHLGVVDERTQFHSALDDILVTKAIFKVVAADYINKMFCG